MTGNIPSPIEITPNFYQLGTPPFPAYLSIGEDVMIIEGGTGPTTEIIIKQIETLGTKAWCGYSFSWMACIQARVGRGNQALRYLSDYVHSFTLRNGFHCNGEQTQKGLGDWF
jgi:alpha-L-fucosidase 2